MMRVRVHLRGSLRSIHDGVIEVVAETAAEAIDAVTSQLPGFKPDANGRKSIRVGGHPTEASLYEPLETTDLHLFPQMAGGKKVGVVQIVIGVVLIVATIFSMGGTAGFSGAYGAVLAGGGTFAQTLAVSVFMIGVSTAIGGLVSLLMPAPGTDSRKGQADSAYLGPGRPTVAIGTPIRVIYGFRRVAFHILAVNINASNTRIY
jgi:predicted phage tail protein